MQIPKFGLTNTELYVYATIVTDIKPIPIGAYVLIEKNTLLLKNINYYFDFDKTTLIPDQFIDELSDQIGTVVEDLYLIGQDMGNIGDLITKTDVEKITPILVVKKGDVVYWDYEEDSWIWDNGDLYMFIPNRFIKVKYVKVKAVQINKTSFTNIIKKHDEIGTEKLITEEMLKEMFNNLEQKLEQQTIQIENRMRQLEGKITTFC